ncbi:L,D-transpeptidase [Legionella septentrionalis]|uniref:L,D-transpeptidase n=1 Tax=Legionella septentrionalis TaxID=2498109 RepID=UPI00227914BB|nr:L,D-transpeptidase [Legionella septentrionalis]
MKLFNNQLILISAKEQAMRCYAGDDLHKTYPVSTGKNGLGEQEGSECTPRGWHQIHSIIGLDNAVNSVFIARRWTGEIYTRELAAQYPGRDWILTRILQLDGLEPGRNKGGSVDSLQRYIYIHGTPDITPLGTPGSRGCIRMNNADIIELSLWIKVGSIVCIE